MYKSKIINRSMKNQAHKILIKKIVKINKLNKMRWILICNLKKKLQSIVKKSYRSQKISLQHLKHSLIFKRENFTILIKLVKY